MLTLLTTEIETFLQQLKDKEHSFSGARGALNRIRKEVSKWAKIKSEGVTAIEENLRPQVKILIEELQNVGIFVVPVGELEGWINVSTKKKNKWIVPALEFLYKEKTPKHLVSFVRTVKDKLINDLFITNYSWGVLACAPLRPKHP